MNPQLLPLLLPPVTGADGLLLQPGQTFGADGLLLQPGQTFGPQPLQGRPVQPVGGAAPKPSLWDRIQERLMPVPSGFRGLLSDADISRARRMGLLSAGVALMSQPFTPTPRSPLQGLGAALQAMQQGTLGSLDVSARVAAAAEQRARQQRIEEQRARIFGKYFPEGQENLPLKDVVVRMTRMMPEFMALGDEEMARALAGYTAAVTPGLFKETEPRPRDVQTRTDVLGPDGKPHIVFYDNDTGEILDVLPQYVDPNRGASAAEDRTLRRLDNLSRQFEAETRSAVDTRRQIEAALMAAPEAPSNAMAALQVVNAFARAMDDRTGVRDQERQQIIEMAPLLQKARLYLRREAMGESVIVPERELQQMIDLLRMRYDGLSEWITQKREKFIKQAQSGADDIESFFFVQPSFIGGESSGLPSRGQMVVPGASNRIRDILNSAAGADRTKRPPR